MQDNILTYQEILNLFTETSLQMKETSLQMKETDRKFQETDRKIQETDKQINETDKIVKEISRQIAEHRVQIGGLGHKFGTFTEGLVYPSIERELFEKFKVTNVTARAKNKKNQVEIDILGYTNGSVNVAYVVEVKSHLKDNALDQILEILSKFKDSFPEHKDKKVYGIIASIDSNERLLKAIEDADIYYASVANDVFELRTSKNFIPKAF